ncbi:urease accessory protein UreD [Blastococcus sp. SYSU DS0539]
MRTSVEVVARRGRDGRTELPVVRASGQLAVRRTGPATVHLVATAFGPLGGDDATIRLVVEDGATLVVRSVAAAVALPGRGDPGPSVQRVLATVDGVLDLRPEPTVATARAHHVSEVIAELAAGAGLTATELVALGRWAEEPGRWTGTTRITREGSPVLHTTVGLGPGGPAWGPAFAPRGYASTVHLGAPSPGADTPGGVRTGEDAVRLPLPGGWVATAWGDRLHRVAASLGALTPAADGVVPAGVPDGRRPQPV